MVLRLGALTLSALSLAMCLSAQPKAIKVCLKAAGPDAQDMTTRVWDDQWEYYQKKYPGSYKGKCK